MTAVGIPHPFAGFGAANSAFALTMADIASGRPQ